MKKTTKELSIIALQSIATIDVLMCELEELEDTTLNKGVLKRKANILKKEIEKQQDIDLPKLFDVDDKVLFNLLRDKQTLLREIAGMEYSDQLDLLSYIDKRKQLRENITHKIT